MAEEGAYLLDWIIEPLASLFETLVGWDHETAVKWVKGIVYGGLAFGVLVVGLKTYYWILPREKD